MGAAWSAARNQARSGAHSTAVEIARSCRRSLHAPPDEAAQDGPNREHGDSSIDPGLRSAVRRGRPTERKRLPSRRPPLTPPEAGRRAPWAEPPRSRTRCSDSRPTRPERPRPADTLSPAVRRLVRQYDLDITGVYGVGARRARSASATSSGCSDGRTDATARAQTSEGSGRPAIGADDAGARQGAPSAAQTTTRRPTEAHHRAARTTPRHPSASPVPTTTVFDCDLSRVLSHRKRERQGDVEIAARELLSSRRAARRCAPFPRSQPAFPTRRGAKAPSSHRVSASCSRRGRQRAPHARRRCDRALDERTARSRRAAPQVGDDDLAGAQFLVHHYARAAACSRRRRRSVPGTRQRRHRPRAP